MQDQNGGARAARGLSVVRDGADAVCNTGAALTSGSSSAGIAGGLSAGAWALTAQIEQPIGLAARPPTW